jgi:hypothetical protein
MKKVGPNLYRAHTGRYYLLVKRAGKQFRRSLKTKDAKLAKRRLREFQEKAGRLARFSGACIWFKWIRAVQGLFDRSAEIIFFTRIARLDRCLSA